MIDRFARIKLRSCDVGGEYFQGGAGKSSTTIQGSPIQDHCWRRSRTSRPASPPTRVFRAPDKAPRRACGVMRCGAGTQNCGSGSAARIVKNAARARDTSPQASAYAASPTCLNNAPGLFSPPLQPRPPKISKTTPCKVAWRSLARISRLNKGILIPRNQVMWRRPMDSCRPGFQNNRMPNAAAT
jgi:hypothetical protein